nr:hypothetical protein BaRGS_031259 [Batillaria attramentaria]
MTSHGDQPSAPEADDTGNTPTGCGQQESEWEAGKMFEEFARVLDPSRGQCASSSLLTWDQAREEAMRRHPDKRIVTRICNVTHERDINVVKMTSCLFLGRLARPHPYIFRQGWYLEDSTGDEIRVFFYLDHDRPALWFKWSQLQVGNFLCLEHAYVHVFLDGKHRLPRRRRV